MITFYRENYPRPQFVRKIWKNLNGIWSFAFDDNAVGQKEHWEVRFPKGRTIRVPFSYETKMSGIGDETVHNVVWYQRKVDVAAFAGKRILLNFEGADYYTMVWVDGVFVGSHHGGYSRFCFDITRAVEGKSAVSLTVRVWDGLDTDQPRGKQRYREKSWGCWYVQTTGIWKTVWMEAVEENYLLSIENTPDFREKCLRLEVETAISEQNFIGHSYVLEADVTFCGEKICSTEFPVTQAIMCLFLPVDEVHLWSPDAPELYEIRYALKKDGACVDMVQSYFGFRSFTIEGNQLFLNGKPIFLRMILDQGYWAESGLTPPDENALISDISILRRLGYNGLRMHQKIEDERFLFWCDVMGILSWSEMPSFYAFTERVEERFVAEWCRIVRQNKNHPSIIVWVPFNESWGVPNVKSDLAMQSFVNGIYYLTKGLDPTRPVVTNDGWEHTISDIVTIHDYRETGLELEKAYLDPEQGIIQNRCSVSGYGQLVFADGYAYRGQPIILSEYGGIAMKNDHGWGYGKATVDEADFLERFTSQNAAIDRIPFFSGFCYTQLTDVMQEVNGLVDMERGSKFTSETEERIAESNRNTGTQK